MWSGRLLWCWLLLLLYCWLLRCNIVLVMLWFRLSFSNRIIYGLVPLRLNQLTHLLAAKHQTAPLREVNLVGIEVFQAAGRNVRLNAVEAFHSLMGCMWPLRLGGVRRSAVVAALLRERRDDTLESGQAGAISILHNDCRQTGCVLKAARWRGDVVVGVGVRSACIVRRCDARISLQVLFEKTPLPASAASMRIGCSLRPDLAPALAVRTRRAGQRSVVLIRRRKRYTR